jgi:hypothetical protein
MTAYTYIGHYKLYVEYVTELPMLVWHGHYRAEMRSESARSQYLLEPELPRLVHSWAHDQGLQHMPSLKMRVTLRLLRVGNDDG